MNQTLCREPIENSLHYYKASDLCLNNNDDDDKLILLIQEIVSCTFEKKLPALILFLKRI